jgi:two-component system response regulator AtoC
MLETADERPHGQTGPAPAWPPALGLVVCGRHGVRMVPLQLDGELVIGRDASCQLSLPEPMLSRHHARFVRRPGSITVEDLGSRHGTWLGGKRVSSAVLDVGASVRLADVVVAVASGLGGVPALSGRESSALVPEALYLGERMREVQALLHRMARTDLAVVILGETGTGKELAVRELHLASDRSRGPLRVLNCAAIPPNLVESTLFGHERGAFTGADRARAGIFEEAQGGVVFLDEVGELSLAAQAALLRVLESRRVSRVGGSREIAVDVRIASATHRDLQTMAARGEFRTDLLHRLFAVSIELPPLRDRREEIGPFAEHFLSRSTRVRWRACKRTTGREMCASSATPWPAPPRWPTGS